MQSSAGATVSPRFELSPAARAELLAFPAQLLGGLPVSSRFVLQTTGFAPRIIWSTESAPTRAGIVFDADEVRALAIGAQAERLWAADLKGFCLRKLHDPSFRVTELAALGGAQPAADRLWSLGRVLRWLDLELSGIELATCDAPSDDGTAPALRGGAASESGAHAA
jgi:hypothetical protein